MLNILTMDFFTHVVFGTLMYILFLKEVTFDFIFLAMIFAILPDLDIFILPLKRVFKSNYLDHRAGSHSYVIGIIISAVLGEIYSLFTQQPFFIVWIIGIVFYGIHVSLDLLTTTKIPCFYPLSKKEYCFYIEKAGSSFTLLITWIFILIIQLIFNTSSDFALYVITIDIFTYFFIFYYSYRIVSGVWISFHLEDNQKYFPGVLPFYYVIFTQKITQNEISLLIEKKTHFTKTATIIYQNQAVLKAEEMVLFHKANAIIKETYYYAKWTVLPIFLKKEGIFSIRFFFLEPMVRARAMYNQYDFDILTQQVVGYKQRYGRIQP